MGLPVSNSTEKTHVAVLFDASVKVYRTDVAPRENSSPGSCDRVIVRFPDKSVAVGSVHVIDFVVLPSSVVVFMSFGHPSNSGGVVSTVRK